MNTASNMPGASQPANAPATPASQAADTDARLLDWFDGVEAILYEACAACGHKSYFRRGFCADCGASPVEVRRSDGLGTVYAVTRVARAALPEWKALAPYAIVLVDLDEGIRMLAHGTAGLAIGERVRIGWFAMGERRIPRAQPLQSS